MNCPTKRNEDAEILLDYCAQTLSPLQTAEFEIHLKQCAECSRLVEAQKEVWGALEAWTPPVVSINFDARLYARIAEEQAAPAWQLWLRRVVQPALPYPFWKSAIPLTVACALVMVGLYVRMPQAAQTAHPQLHADKVDIEKVEKTLEDFDILTPPAQTKTGSM
jgi:hypothetical protein